MPLADAMERAGIELTDEERYEIDLYNRGRDLAHLVPSPGWDTALAMLQSYPANAVRDLMGLAPGDPAVETAHAAASGAAQVVAHFIQDVQNAVDASRQMPDALKKGLRAVKAATPIS